MAEGIPGAPNNYDFGLEFDYSVWVPGTQIDLVNVPFNNDYRDVVKFENKDALNTYIDGLRPAGVTLNQLSYVKPNQPVAIPISHNRAIKYNYLRVSNPIQPIPGGDEIKYYYYFILDATYVNPGRTDLIVQLDLWQTYVYDLSFGRCYVERGHIGIANFKQMDAFGRSYLTVPEGLDTGGEYTVAAVRDRWIMSPTPYSDATRYLSHDVLVFSAADLMADAGDATDPKLVSATGTIFQGTIHGANVYIFDPESFLAFMNGAKDTPWITQSILSITMIPKVNRYHPGFAYNPFPVPTEAPALAPRNLSHSMFENWRESPDFLNQIPERYRHLHKFKTYPYCAIEMTTYHGSPVMLKPESWNSRDAIIMERASLVPPAQRVEFTPRDYNRRTSNAEVLWPPPVTGYLANVVGDDWGEYLDLVTQIANFPTMSIVNNGAIGYLAANTHAIANQYKAADWTQQRALGSAQGQYDIATGAMHTAMDVAGSAMNADIAQTANTNRTMAARGIVDLWTGMAGGAGGGAAFGGGAGAVAGMAGATMSGIGNLIGQSIQQGANDEATAIRNTAAAETVIQQNKQSQLMRDTNKSLADWSARGDYGIQIGALDAKVQDANLIQPTTSGQVGGETINIVNGGLKVSLRWKILDDAAYRRIGDYWLRYGYAIHASVVPPQSLMVMSKFTYWRMKETYIVSSQVPEGHKQGVRGILEKGVTVWANPADIGRIDWADNEPLPNVSY